MFTFRLVGASLKEVTQNLPGAELIEFINDLGAWDEYREVLLRIPEIEVARSPPRRMHYYL